MRKLVLGLALLTVFIGCKDNEDEIDKVETKIEYPCKYTVVLEKAINPEFTNSENERTITFDIPNDVYGSGAPDVDKTCKYYSYKIFANEFVKYQSSFTNLGNLSVGSEYFYIGRMNNGDSFRFDYTNTKSNGIIKVLFTCVHKE